MVWHNELPDSRALCCRVLLEREWRGQSMERESNVDQRQDEELDEVTRYGDQRGELGWEDE